MPDVIVTGLPRSGLTAVAALVDYLPNAVCLNLSWTLTMNAQSDALSYAKWIAGDFLWKRTLLTHREPVGDQRTAEGMPLTDGLRDPRQVKDANGDPATVLFTRPDLRGDFILGQKNHFFFTAMLPTLAMFRHFKIIAVIRHPLDTINSWRNLPDYPLGQGRLPLGRYYWPEADQIASSYHNATDRMVQLYELCLQRYHELRESIHILKYEDVVYDPMLVSKTLGVETLSHAAPMVDVRPRVRHAADTGALRESIHKYGVFTKLYYPEI